MQDSRTGGLAALSSETQGRINPILLMHLQQQGEQDPHVLITGLLSSSIYDHLSTFHVLDSEIIYFFRAEGPMQQNSLVARPTTGAQGSFVY